MWHSDAVTAQDCEASSSPCCSHGGFAILENVLAIYDLYQGGTPAHFPEAVT